MLVVAEMIGTNAGFRLGDEPAGMHLVLRALPPGALRGYQPEHLLVGHGRGVHGPEAAAALEQAYARSRRDLPRLAIRVPQLVVGAIKRR